MDTPESNTSNPQTIPGFITSSQQPQNKHPKSNNEQSHFQQSFCFYLAVGSLRMKEAAGMPLDGPQQCAATSNPHPPHSVGRKLLRYVSALCLSGKQLPGIDFWLRWRERERERDSRHGPGLKYWDASQDRSRKKKKNVSHCCGCNSSRFDDAGEPHGVHIK